MTVVDTNDACFNASAIAAIEKWLYTPRLRDGAPVTRKSVQQVITYKLSESLSADEQPRRAVMSKLRRVQKLLQKSESTKALEILNDVEERYGDSFRAQELAVFYRLRGYARFFEKDYRGALDDLRIARQRGLFAKEADAITGLIRQLEVQLGEAAPSDLDQPADQSEASTDEPASQ